MKEKIRLGAVFLSVMALALALWTLPGVMGGIASAQLLDITFKIDESGSMSGEIDDVKNNVNFIFQELQSAGLDFTVGLVGFGASLSGPPHGVNTQEPHLHIAQTSDQTAFGNAVAELVANGGTERGYDAVVFSETDPSVGLREGAFVCNILITDDVSNGDQTPNAQQAAIDALNARGAVFFGVVPLGGDEEASYLPLADATGGQLFGLSAFQNDATAVLEAILAECQKAAVGLDHYLGYTAREPRGSISPSATATLTDQFGTGKYKIVGKSVTHLNPVEKTHDEVVTEISEPDVHLEAYGLMRLEGSHTPQTVEVTNQFGTITVTTRSPSKLMVPSTKAIEGFPRRELPETEGELPEDRVDHYLCYNLDSYSGFTSLTVGVNDQFDEFRVNGTNNFIVFRPVYLCNPVAKQLEGKEEEPIKNEAAHLLCYGGGFKDRRSLEVPIGVNNQIVEASELEGQFLDIRREAGVLCVPSTKNVSGFCGDGVVDEGEECDLGDQNGVPDSGCSEECTTVEVEPEK